MKKWQALFLVSFLIGTALQAQEVYHAGEYIPAVEKRNWVEISAAATRSFYRLQDVGKQDQLTHQTGLSGRALLVLTPWLGIGAEGTWFEKEKSIAYVPGYKTIRYGLIGKFTLTPDTQPSVYVLAGTGKTKREFSYAFNLQETDTTSYILSGVGLEVSVFRGLFIAAEVDGVYNLHRHVSRFFALNRRWEIEVSARAGIRF